MSHKIAVMRSWRYGLVNAEVMLRGDIPPLARYVYAILSTFANADRTAWPTPATLAAASGLAKSTVHNALGSLEEAGVITRTRRAAASGRSMATLITLTDEPGREGPPHGPSPEGGSATRTLGGSATRTHDANPEQGEGPPHAGEGPSHGPSEGPSHGPITEPLEQLPAREDVLNLRGPIVARCRKCRIEHLDGETCVQAGRRLAATRARGIATVRHAMAGREEVPP